MVLGFLIFYFGNADVKHAVQFCFNYISLQAQLLAPKSFNFIYGLCAIVFATFGDDEIQNLLATVTEKSFLKIAQEKPRIFLVLVFSLLSSALDHHSATMPSPCYKTLFAFQPILNFKNLYLAQLQPQNRGESRFSSIFLSITGFHFSIEMVFAPQS